MCGLFYLRSKGYPYKKYSYKKYPYKKYPYKKYPYEKGNDNNNDKHT